LSFVHAPQNIEMGESPVDAVRSKPNNSITRSVALVASGEADVAISAGNTGAFAATATLNLRRLEGVRRPGIAVTMQTMVGSVTLMDMGSNLVCKPIDLFQYGVMAAIYHQYVFGVEKPRIGLLNIGSEPGKGPALLKEAFAMLQASNNLNFIGNVEGGDVFHGNCDVVVCDGFAGNILLKVAEGVAESIVSRLSAAKKSDIWSKLGLNLLRPTLRRIAESMDFAEYGGAPLLGMQGECLICHGRSDARAFKNAVRAALSFSRHDVNGHIVAALAAEQRTPAGTSLLKEAKEEIAERTK
jgi:phosphate acyltransferase